MAEAKRHGTCPVWIGHLLASPVRALFQNPQKILATYLAPGARVLEVGPGMGFFTLPMARLIGPEGRVFSVDVQEKMLAGLTSRARRAGLAGRIEARVCEPGSLGVADLAGTIDFVLAFAVVHEIGDAARFFGEVQEVLKPRGRILFAEPTGHVSADAFDESISAARRCGLEKVESPKIARSHAAVLRRA
jgi:SAM-dependent methyltransferase